MSIWCIAYRKQLQWFCKEVYDLLEERKCYIVRGTRLWISRLTSEKGTKLEDIHTIISPSLRRWANAVTS